MFRLITCILSAALSLVAQSSEPASKPTVRLPTFPNSTCPIMGKKVSMSLFVDTDLGRFYVCCKPCIKKIKADPVAAQKSGYPTVKPVANTVCPVSGEPIGDQREEITLQGFTFVLCCAGCADAARANAQVVLTKLDEPKLRDVGNTTCPVTDKPVAANAFVVVGDAIVHLSDPGCVAEVEKDPAAVLAKAETIRKKQPARAPHVHAPKKSEVGGQKGKQEAK